MEPEDIEESDALATFASEPELRRIPELFDNDAQVGAAYLLGYEAGWAAAVVEWGTSNA